jgi:ribosome-binding ATPase YchF (GTP1/OBG family)
VKIAVYGIEDFVVGKKIVADERLDRLKELLRPAKVIYSQVEFVDESNIKNVPAVVCLDSRKDDLILMDLEYIETKFASSDDKERQVLSFCQEQLNKEIFLSELQFSDEQALIVNRLGFVTAKPIILISQDKINDSADIARCAFESSGMISFFTFNDKELKSWPIKKGITAHEAAGHIHSDIQRGFIKAEVLSYDDIVRSGGINQAKSQGLMRLEGKEYIVKDGELMKFRFSV